MNNEDIKAFDLEKTTKSLNQIGSKVAVQFGADRIRRTIGYILSANVVIFGALASFFELGFSVDTLFLPEFWTRSFVTIGIALLLHFVWSKIGEYESKDDLNRVETLRQIQDENKKIDENGWTNDFVRFIDRQNSERKKLKMKQKFYKGFLFLRRSQNKTMKIKAIDLLEKLENAEEKERKNILKELEKLNFDFESERVSYPKIKEGHFRTEAQNPDTGEDFLELELQKSNILKKALTKSITVIASLFISGISFGFMGISLAAFVLLLARLTIWIMNAFLGYGEGIYNVKELEISVLGNRLLLLKTFNEFKKQGGHIKEPFGKIIKMEVEKCQEEQEKID